MFFALYERNRLQMHAIVLHPIRTPSPESCNARSNPKNEATDLSALCWHNPIEINVFCIVLPQMCACNPPAFWFMGGMNLTMIGQATWPYSTACSAVCACIAWLARIGFHRALIARSSCFHCSLIARFSDHDNQCVPVCVLLRRSLFLLKHWI